MPQIRLLIPGFLAASVLLGASACEKQPSAPAPSATPTPAPAHPPTPASAPPSASPAAPAAPHSPASAPAGSLTANGVTFKVPDGWKSVPPSNQMRIAEIQVPDPSGDAAKSCVIAFSTAGGDVDSNIARWGGQILDASGQPSKPEPVVRDVGGLKVHTVEFKGAYQGMGEAAKSDWMLRGAIVETPSGLLFVKMTGPAAAMEAAKANWNAMMDSAHKG